MKHYDSIIDALADLKKRGYVSDFTTETFCLYYRELDIRIYPEEFQVDEVYRFEGNSSYADDSSILLLSHHLLD